jgi:RNA polymerase sigma factor (sigma-70 family)
VFFVVMEELCIRLADDLEGAFPDLVEAMRDDLYAGLRRLHGGEAEDLAQEALIRAFRALREYEPDRIRSMQLRAWVWTIALNLGRNHARDRARRPTPVELEDRHGIDDPEPVDATAWHRRLGLLSPAQRRAVVLRHVVGLSPSEIAVVTGRPEGTVKADVSRGLVRLRSILEEET